jgi:hypothetical protein
VHPHSSEAAVRQVVVELRLPEVLPQDFPVRLERALEGSSMHAGRAYENFC